MSIYVLKSYVEECLKRGIEPTFKGLKRYNLTKRVEIY